MIWLQQGKLKTKNSIILSNWWNSEKFFWNNQVQTFNPINQEEEGLTDNGEFMYKLLVYGNFNSDFAVLALILSI